MTVYGLLRVCLEHGYTQDKLGRALNNMLNIVPLSVCWL